MLRCATTSKLGEGDLLLPDCVLARKGSRRTLNEMASPRRANQIGVTGISDDDVPDVEVVKKPKRSEGPVMLDMDTLRGLLQEQSQGLLSSHQRQLDQAVSRMEKRQEDMFRTMTGRLDEAATKMEHMQSVMESLSKRVTVLENAKDCSTKAPSETSTRMTLVFGGWPRETRRQVILQDLQRALKETQTVTMLDDDPFTTGPRRSIALANCWPRSGEEMAHVKRRMHNVISAFIRAEPKTSSGERIWTSFSKTQQERKRGAHATWIKKILKALNVDEAHSAVDVERSTGSSWLGSTKVSGIGKVEKDNLFVQERTERTTGCTWVASPGSWEWLHLISRRPFERRNADDWMP